VLFALLAPVAPTWCAACTPNELTGGNYNVEGIVHHVRLRYDTARAQLRELRKRFPSGASGESSTGVMETLSKSA